MQNNKNSNIHQAKMAAAEIKRYQEAQAKCPKKTSPDAEVKERRSHTYHPSSGARDEKECRYCHEHGHQIKFRGKLTCPKLIAKEEREAKGRALRNDREHRRQASWQQQIQDASGCEGDGWTTTGDAESWRKRQERKVRGGSKISYKRPVAPNPFEIPSDSDDEEEIVGPLPLPPKKLDESNPWSKGPSAAFLAPPTLERAVATSSSPSSNSLAQKLYDDEKWQQMVSNHKPIISWADECDSDSD